MSEATRRPCQECGATYRYALDLYEHLVTAHQWRPSRTAGLERLR